MNRFSIIYALIFCFLISSCTKQHKDTSTEKFQFATPAEVGMVSDSLVKIEKMVMDFVDAKKYPGAVTLIAKNGKIIYESEVGWSDSLRTEPYRKDHLFRLASMTKPIVSVAAMQLIEQGKLNLDDPVGKYITSFNETGVLTDFNPADSTYTSKPSESTPTIRQLLTHTAGVPYGFMNPSVNGAIYDKNDIPDLSTNLNMDIKDVAYKLGDLPLMHEPGKKWMYGLNTDVLGRVVEVASGEKLDNYIRTNITKPLGIERLDFYFDGSEKKNLTKVYIPMKDSTNMQVNQMGKMYIADYPTDGAKSYLSGGSGMTGTARDYLLFCQAMLNNGELDGAQILKKETAKSMHEDQLGSVPYPWGPMTFGFGFDVAKNHPFRPKGTYSWGGAFSTVFWIDPVNDLIVIQLRQVLSSPFNNDINSKLEKIVYGALADPK